MKFDRDTVDPANGTSTNSLTGRIEGPSQVQLLAQVRRYAAFPHVTILLHGEPGTGKSVWARCIHEMSPVRNGPFCTLSLAAVEDSLASSELFGHVAGGFTGARAGRAGAFLSASGGTLFLDEIGKASLMVQRKLLLAIESRVIQPVGSDRTVPVTARFIAATNVELQALVTKAMFLPDLLTRLGLFIVRLLPLRERRQEIPMFVQSMIARHCSSFGIVQPPVVHESLMRSLCRAPWSGNLRELDGVIQRLLVDSQGAKVLTLAHCESDLSFLCEVTGDARSLSPSTVRQAAQNASSRREAARQLGVSESTFYRRLRSADASSRFDAMDSTPNEPGV